MTDAKGAMAGILDWIDRAYLFIILPVIGIAVSIGVFIWCALREMPEPEPMSALSEEGSYCSIEVQGMSTWVMEVSGDESYCFYKALDTDGGSHMVSLSDERYEDFADIVEYTYSAKKWVVPEPKELTGVVRTFSQESIRSLAKCLYMDQAEYVELYGATFLDTNNDANTDIVAPFIYVLGGSVLILVFKLILVIEERGERKRSCRERPPVNDFPRN